MRFLPGPDQLALLIPIVAIVLAMGGKLVKTLTEHQQRMAEMMAQQQRALMEMETRRLAAPPVDLATQHELQTLRDRLARMEAEVAQSKANQDVGA